MTAKHIRDALAAHASPAVAASSARFFKTAPGEYAAGDQFIGVRVPVLRTLSREFRALPLGEIESLLQSPVHEHRHLALMILVLRMAKWDEPQRKIGFAFYLRNTAFINNWDLVDCSAPHVVGLHLVDKSRSPLHRLAKSNSLWERRIAIVATQHFIRQNDFADTLQVAERLRTDREDLIHKATGWMLREVGDRNVAVLDGFLSAHAGTMPRTMLRYAIEKFPQARRSYFMNLTKS